MQIFTISINQNLVNPPSGETHIATSWQVATYPNFKNDAFRIIDALASTAYLTEISSTVNDDVDDILYYRYQLHYSDGTTSGWTGVASHTIANSPNTASPILIATPTIKASISYENNIAGELILETDPIRFFIGSSTHIANDWVVTDDAGIEIYSSIGDATALVNKTFPVTQLVDGKLYNVAVKHITNDGNSEYGKITFSTFIVKGVYFIITPTEDFFAERKLFFGLDIKTSMFKYVDLIIRDSNNAIVTHNSNQTTLTPSIVTSGLLLGQQYRLTARLQLRDNSYTDTVTIFDKTIGDYTLYPVDESVTYINKFDFIQEVLLHSATVQSSKQLSDGTILFTQSNSNHIYKGEYKNRVFTNKGVAFSLPAEDKIGTPYINITPMYNGDVLVNYASNTNALNNQYSVFKLYGFNPIKKEFTLKNTITQEQEWLSTGVSSSAFVSPDNNLYYVPAIEVDKAGDEIPLSLYKLDCSTFERSKVDDLPFIATKHVSIVPLNKDTFLVLGGSNGSAIVNNRIVWKRDNNNVYLYSTVTNTFTEIATFNTNVVADTIYNLQGYRRKDGKVIMFNSVREGASLGNQAVIELNLIDNTITVQDNDNSDTLPYRNTICLNSGEFLRISSKVRDPQTMYVYATNTVAANQTHENTTIVNNPNLVVHIGETVTIEDLNDYDSIFIEGDSDTNTGILELQSPDSDNILVYTYKDLIITRDTTMTQAQMDNGGWTNIIQSFGVTLNIVD